MKFYKLKKLARLISLDSLLPSSDLMRAVVSDLISVADERWPITIIMNPTLFLQAKDY